MRRKCKFGQKSYRYLNTQKNSIDYFKRWNDVSQKVVGDIDESSRTRWPGYGYQRVWARQVLELVVTRYLYHYIPALLKTYRNLPFLPVPSWNPRKKTIVIILCEYHVTVEQARDYGIETVYGYIVHLATS